jgi:hypothetical protein
VSVVEMAHRLSDAEKRDAARRDILADPSITGATLDARYGMKPGWGGSRKRKVLAERDGDAKATAKPRPQTATPPLPDRDTAPAATADPSTPARTGWARRIQVAGVVVVAAVAAVISYTHMRHLAIGAGEGWRADILPLSVDGMMAVASMKALDQRRAGKRALLPWAALLLGAGASLAANIAAAQPTLVGRLVAAWPPVALVIALELLLHEAADPKEDP